MGQHRGGGNNNSFVLSWSIGELICDTRSQKFKIGGMMPQLIIVYLIIAYLASCWPFDEEVWKGYVYPNRYNLLVDKYVGTFKTLEDCRNASVVMLNNISSIEKGDYECGLNCKPQRDLNICEETQR